MSADQLNMSDTQVPWLGLVPRHWTPMRLRDSVENCLNGVWGDEPRGDENDIAVIRVADFDRGNRRTFAHQTVRNVGEDQRRSRELAAGDLLIEKSGGGEQQSVGMVVEYTGEANAVCSNFVARMRPREGVSPRYLTYVHAHLYSRAVPTLSIKQSTGIQNLDSTAYLGEKLHLPPLNEQVAIASYLDAETKRIDGLIAAKRELRSTLDGFARSTFLAEVIALSTLLPGKPDSRLPWISNIPSTWTRCKVKHLVLHFDQGVSPQCESRPPGEGEWGVLKAGCINSGTFNPMESKALPPEIPSLPEVTVCEGDLIISRANTQDLVGRSAVATQDYPRLMLSDKLYRLKVDTGRCVPEFVRRTMWVPAVRSRIEERATGASPSMLNIDRRTILELDLVLPPIEDQLALLQKVDESASAIGELIRHVDQELALLIQLRSSTITDAVLGRIDVRPARQQHEAREAAV